MLASKEPFSVLLYIKRNFSFLILIAAVLFSACFSPYQGEAVGDFGKMADSSDGINWTPITTTTFGTTMNDSIYGIAYGGGRFVAVGSGGKMAYWDD